MELSRKVTEVAQAVLQLDSEANSIAFTTIVAVSGLKLLTFHRTEWSVSDLRELAVDWQVRAAVTAITAPQGLQHPSFL